MNGQIQDAGNQSPNIFTSELAGNADGVFIYHGTGGNVPADQQLMFGRSGIPLESNTDYRVSIDIGRQNTASAGPFEVQINGQVIGQIDVNSGTVKDWQTLTFDFNSGTDTTANFQLFNTSTNGTGNDFGIDNITFTRNPLILSNIATASVEVLMLDSDNDGVGDAIDIDLSLIHI